VLEAAQCLCGTCSREQDGSGDGNIAGVDVANLGLAVPGVLVEAQLALKHNLYV
tara:strand:+ start:529 stop:690 length:162 start_codon:yes stop_codon:yes gene_type:complete